MSYTLFRSLTHLENQVFPATESIKQLIETIGRDVVQFRRNTQISYHFVDRARSVCDIINALIQKVDEEDDWDSYDKFTDASDLLEELLLASTATTQDEAHRYLCEDKDVDRCIESTTAWESNRGRLREFLYSLRAKPEIAELLPVANDEEIEIIEAGKHDDASFLLELHQSIKRHTFRQRAEGSVPQLIEFVNDRLADLYALAQGEVLEDVLAITTIKTAMLVFGIMEISMDPRVEKNRTHHLKLEPVWDAAHSLLVFFLDIAESADAPVDEMIIGAINEKFEAFLLVLRTIPDAPLPASYIQLMKQAGNIRRPYFAQAVAVISLCRFLARHYENLTKEQRTATTVEPLEKACRESLAALKVAADSLPTLKNLDMNAPEDARVGEALVAARKEIQGCFDHFALTSHWTHYEKIFKQAAEKDRLRTAQLGKVLASRPSRTPDSTSVLVQVNVKVCDGSSDGTVIKVLSVGVEPETRLRALRWYISKALGPQESSRALRDSSFLVRRAADSPEGDSLVTYRMHTAIEDIAQGTEVCELVLVLA
ncbi:hypothetical protein DFH94DRAFT_695822 [Russula ochroleuca]|uniref:Uncharacterized protein n=1 Tax=Russula ochroleuca TaxID=152965 RepID=A0A9P5K1S7_9AGAM|nr:hypothetical protein DFH94DRAFT_695822 [Russula ochroleuca]